MRVYKIVSVSVVMLLITVVFAGVSTIPAVASANARGANVLIPTYITISAPSFVAANMSVTGGAGFFNVTGRLTANGAGVVGEEVAVELLDHGQWLPEGWGWTNSTGSYDISISQGLLTFSWRAKFYGTDVYAGSTSSARNVTVYATPFTYSGVHDTTTGDIGVLNALTGFVDEHPMVGGLIQFNAAQTVYETAIKNYNWKYVSEDKKYTGSQRTQNQTVDFQFPFPENYTVTLIMDDGRGHYSAPISQSLNLSLEPGDLIFVRSNGIWAPIFKMAGQDYTHVGMYIGNGEVVESTPFPDHGSPLNGVHISQLTGWAYPTETFATVYRVNTNSTTKQKAIDFAVLAASNGYGYDWKGLANNTKNTAGPGFYCSELIWAAYWVASNHTINLGHTSKALISPNLYRGWVLPDQIAVLLTPVAGHWEHYP